MNLGWTIAGTAAGLLAGAALSGQVVRLSVASGEPPRTTCPACAAPLPRFAAVRCAGCHGLLGHFPVLELASGVAVGALAGRFAGTPEVAAFCVLGAVGVALADIDWHVQRLPDRLTLPAYPALLGLLALAALLGHQAWPLLRAVLGGLALGGAYLLGGLIRPGDIGAGDIKVAGLTGLALGWLGWRAVLDGAVLGIVLAGLAGLAMLAARRVTLRSHISFGPFLVCGALLVMLAAGPRPG
jgi:leader peptidase (prepilin peptidase) / N-methyltransferase